MAAKPETTAQDVVSTFVSKKPTEYVLQDLRSFSILFVEAKTDILGQTWSFPNPHQVVFVSKPNKLCHNIKYKM